MIFGMAGTTRQAMEEIYARKMMMNLSPTMRTPPTCTSTGKPKGGATAANKNRATLAKLLAEPPQDASKKNRATLAQLLAATKADQAKKVG